MELGKVTYFVSQDLVNILIYEGTYSVSMRLPFVWIEKGRKSVQKCPHFLYFYIDLKFLLEYNKTKKYINSTLEYFFIWFE